MFYKLHPHSISVDIKSIFIVYSISQLTALFRLQIKNNYARHLRHYSYMHTHTWSAKNFFWILLFFVYDLIIYLYVCVCAYKI